MTRTVFDELQFQTLFNIEEKYKTEDARNDGRLKAHYIPTLALKNITDKSRKEAIKKLKHSAKSEILKLRSSKPSPKNGRLHGFWVQQLANATLALSELTEDA